MRLLPLFRETVKAWLVVPSLLELLNSKCLMTEYLRLSLKASNSGISIQKVRGCISFKREHTTPVEDII